MKSINQAINLSIQLANTIFSVFVIVVVEDDLENVVCVFRNPLLLSNANTITPDIRIIIPAMIRKTPAIIPPRKLILA